MKKSFKSIVLFFTLFLINPAVLLGQTEYMIEKFSDDYFGKIIIDEGFEEEVFKKGKIIIINQATKKEIIEIYSDELVFDFDSKGEVAINEDVLFYQDFNFDGTQDLAIQDGMFSCYHGPSYQIYLMTNGHFAHSEEFSRLSQEYCGMFQVDHDKRTISTMSKSGYTWRQHSTFVVENDIPVIIRIREFNFDNGEWKEEVGHFPMWIIFIAGLVFLVAVFRKKKK